MEKPIINTESGLTITFNNAVNGWDFYQTKRQLLALGDIEKVGINSFYDLMFGNIKIFVESIVDGNGQTVEVELESILKQLTPKEVNEVEKSIMALWKVASGSTDAKKKE